MSILLVASVALACDPTSSITFENRTDQPVEIFIDGQYDLSLGPNQTKKVDTITFKEALIEARALDGKVVLSRTITEQDLDADSRITIPGGAR